MLQRPTAMEPTPRSTEIKARDLELSLREGAALARDSCEGCPRTFRNSLMEAPQPDRALPFSIYECIKQQLELRRHPVRYSLAGVQQRGDIKCERAAAS